MRVAALRIIDGLSVHRLTTGGDIDVPIGPTVEELRDTLCLYHPGIEAMGGEPAADLLSQVQTVLREIVKTVNGQFISKAPDTDQYYLDLKKDIDYDAQIEKRAESLDDDALDRAYFGAISQLMERAEDNQYVTGYKIWQYQIEWQERHAERDGYLFFGAPNDRPTAQPERDFYIYFIQPFNPPKFKDESKTDEVFFRLKGLDDAFRRHLSFYAAAQELASTSSSSAKSIYLDKAQGALREMSRWLQEKQLTAYEVTYQGKAKTLQQWTKGINLRDKARLGPDDRINFRDVANVVAGLALAPHFQELAPDYPAFSMLLTRSNRAHMIGSALKTLAGGTRPKDATAVLDALDMLDADRIDPAKSRYAKEVLGRLKSKGHGQVVNRGELIVGTAPDVEHFSLGKSRLEPDLLVAVLAGLAYNGDIVLAITGDKIDSSKLALLTERSLDELTSFKHIEAPKEINVAVLRALYELLGQAPGWAQKAVQGDEDAVKTLIESVSALVKHVLDVTTDMATRLSFWGVPLLRKEEISDWKAKLDALKAFLESLSPYNTVGKLKNLRIRGDDIAAQKQNLELLATVQRLRELVDELGPTASYLSSAELALKNDDPWVKKAQETRRQVLDKLAQDRAGQNVAALRKTLADLKKGYLATYIGQHSRARLRGSGGRGTPPGRRALLGIDTRTTRGGRIS